MEAALRRRIIYTCTPVVQQDAGRVPPSSSSIRQPMGHPPPSPVDRVLGGSLSPQLVPTLLAGHCLGCTCAAGVGRSGGSGAGLSPACFLTQPSLEETPHLLLLLLGSPSICPVHMAKFLLSPSRMICLPTWKTLSELTHSSHPTCAMSCASCHPHLFLLVGPASRPMPSSPAAASWQWDVGVPSRGARTQLCPQRCGTGHTEVLVARGQGHPCPKQHLLLICCCVWCRGFPGHQATAGDTKTSSFPLGLSSSSERPASSCDGSCIAQLVLTLGVSPTPHSSLALSPEGIGAERSDGPSLAARRRARARVWEILN